MENESVLPENWNMENHKLFDKIITWNDDLVDNKKYFSVNYIQCPYKYDKNLRITLDYEEDLIFFTKIFEHFYSSKKYFSLEEVLKWLHENPNIAKINMHKNPKYLTKLNEHGTYVSKEIDVSLNI